MKKYVTHNDKEINTGGTSLMGYVETTFDKLYEKFGEPTETDGYKVDAEWEIEFSDGNVATIYNWKNGFNYEGENGLPVEEITDWHIGGFDTKVVDMVTEIINE